MTLFELDAAELDLLGKLEAIYDAAGDEPGAPLPDTDAAGLLDAHLESLAAVQEQLGAKLAGYVKAIQAKRGRAAGLLFEISQYEAEFARLKKQAATEEARAGLLESRLLAFLQRRGLSEFDAGSYRLKVAQAGGAQPVQLADGVMPEDLPEAFHRVIPARVEFDRTAIAARLKAGEKITIQVPDESGEAREIEAAWLGPRKVVLKIK